MTGPDIRKQDFAQTLARGLLCLEALAEAGAPLTTSQVAQAMGISRAAVRRVLLTLEHLGYVRESRGLFASAPKILALGRGLFGSTSIWTAVTPEVVAIANRFDEPCSISVLDGRDIMFVCRDATRRIYTSRLGIGDRLPAHCSASGKLLLSRLDEPALDALFAGHVLRPQGPASLTEIAALKDALGQVRAQGFAVAADEMEDGTLSIAVPLRERSGRVAAAMSLASHRSRISPAELRADVLPVLREAAARIERLLSDYQTRGWVVL